MADFPEAARPLYELTPRHDFFVGIDSDGCAFDTMEIKHKECFIPNIIKFWDLQPVSKYAREAAEFVNLYSTWRGINRWPALVMVFDLLREREEVRARNAAIPEARDLRAFIDSGFPLSNEGLQAYMAEVGATSELEKGLAWSRAVNASVDDMVHGVAPFPYVRESLALMESQADMVVVSATPVPALTREWTEHDIARYVRVIAGQEMGKKSQHLALATGGKYAPDRVLMIGDAPGDLKAAQATGALFYPITPGHEDEAWRRFHDEAFHRFVEGTYAGAYQDGLIEAYLQHLPDTPPWKRR
ncbi:MAG: HAD family hydrolase [Bacteroidetes bacterium]|nr:haloacid dehalogenase [Rhodothermaceae bacterium RA]RMH64497.1 MAG: HAD family hydrolase [Bacteroidota bacterium]